VKNLGGEEISTRIRASGKGRRVVQRPKKGRDRKRSWFDDFDLLFWTRQRYIFVQIIIVLLCSLVLRKVSQDIMRQVSGLATSNGAPRPNLHHVSIYSRGPSIAK
jgi:hypothetical protein